MHALLHYRFLCLLACWALLVTSGCGDNSLPDESDPDAACAALRTALDAWKNGEEVQRLEDGDPPVYFTDMSHLRGAKLESYVIDSKTQRFGLSIICKADLTIRDENGQSKQKTATYQIDTQDAVVIVPGDG